MKRLIAVVGLVFLVGCRPPPAEMTREEIAQREAEVIRTLEAHVEAFYEAAVQGDLQAVASLWTPDALFLGPGIRLSGSEIPASLAEQFETSTLTAYDFEFLDWFIHGDVAYGICSYDETYLVEGQEVTVRNYGFDRWEKVNGVWMVDRLVAGPRDAPPEG